jgi:hypothetical protein
MSVEQAIEFGGNTFDIDPESMNTWKNERYVLNFIVN